MSAPDPEAARQAARQVQAVQATRLFLPAYAAATAILFLPPVLRMAGVDLLPPGVYTILAPTLLLAMSAALVWWYLRLGTLGQWKPGGGPRFSILAAAITGEYRSTEAEPPARPPGSVPASPLGILAVEVDRCAAQLGEAGEPALGESVRAGLREAEALASALAVHEGTAPPERIQAARAAMGSFEDHVVGLQRALGPSGIADAAAWTERLEGDLTALRAAGDALRQRPAAPATQAGEPPIPPR